MRIGEVLDKKRDIIIRRWRELIFETYPDITARILDADKNPFSNPVGATLARELPFLYDALLHTPDPEVIASHLDPIIRIRAVQDFSPAQAVGFVFMLKDVIREQFEKGSRENGPPQELLAIESRIDELALQAFDVYLHVEMAAVGDDGSLHDAQYAPASRKRNAAPLDRRIPIAGATGQVADFRSLRVRVRRRSVPSTPAFGGESLRRVPGGARRDRFSPLRQIVPAIGGRASGQRNV